LHILSNILFRNTIQDPTLSGARLGYPSKVHKVLLFYGRNLHVTDVPVMWFIRIFMIISLLLSVNREDRYTDMVVSEPTFFVY
jgi:hypothetical protein